jgi:hypothetical protein
MLKLLMMNKEDSQYFKKLDNYIKSVNFNSEIIEQFERIYVLVSGGIDSTLLYDYFKFLFPKKTIPLNCFNPFEANDTLKEISKDTEYIEIKPLEKINYGKILQESFLKLNEASKLRDENKYNKKVFPCCYYIKHKEFLKQDYLKNENYCIISGIRHGEGRQRGIFLSQMRNNPFKIDEIHPYELEYKKESKEIFYSCDNTYIGKFIHVHKTGLTYVYPLRDSLKKNLPKNILKTLKDKYVNLDHSGCSICPIILLFDLQEDAKKIFKTSIKYLKKLIDKGKFKPSQSLCNYNKQINSLVKEKTLDRFF